MKKKNIIALCLIVVIAAVAGTGIYINQQNNHKDKVTTTKKVAKVENSDKKATKKVTKDAQPLTREGAVQAAQNLLQEVNKAPDGKSTDKERLALLKKSTKNYTKVLTPQALSKVRLTDFMKTDSRGGSLTAQALINITQSIKGDGNKHIVAADSKSYNGIVYFDKENKTATVPVDLFTKSATNLGMEFIYTNGEWVLQPYSLISEITIRLTDQEALNATPEGQAEKSVKDSAKTSTDKNSNNSAKSSEESK